MLVASRAGPTTGAGDGLRLGSLTDTRRRWGNGCIPNRQSRCHVKYLVTDADDDDVNDLPEPDPRWARARRAIEAAEHGGGWARVYMAAEGDVAALTLALSLVANPKYRQRTLVSHLLIEAAINAALELAELAESRRDES